MNKSKSKNDIKKPVSSVLSKHCYKQNTVLEPLNGSLTIFNDYLCTKKAATYLSISEATLRNLCSNGQVVYYKFGRRSRFLKSDLDSLMSRVNGKDMRYGN